MPTGLGSATASPTNSSPTLCARVSTDSTSLSAHSSPFNFPGKLISFSKHPDSLTPVLEGIPLHPVLTSPTHSGPCSRAQSPQPPAEPLLLFQSDSTLLCLDPTIKHGGGTAGLFLGALKGAALPPDLVPRGLSTRDSAAATRAAADIISQVQAIGDEAMRGFLTAQSSLMPKVGSFVIQRCEAF
ncbi:hypothetical protein HYPSUDRAFT_205091 [Hypholoma sublateritium FD-334 SS-4]|uniref:Uncharacterized protein n=1 Tax=Hypholoma sublateritium (strain FD-334 SS-4) TaxID=945553 RepID=A0A0D2KW20_HYPSF|nr:hypothetical protein HYPSUDRAFT_205091 [Hypholoma sublateritium FD-334 SS-4]